MEITGVDVVRSDGGLVHVRPAAERDRTAMLSVFERCSDRSIYYRFFSLSRYSLADSVDRMLQAADADHVTLLATIGTDTTGIAEYHRVTPTTAEFAVLVDDHEHHEGVGTLLLEHLAGVARANGIRYFVADILCENAAMSKVVDTLGFQATWERSGSVNRVTLDLQPTESTVAVVDERERRADVASLRAVLAPSSIAVVGASTRPLAVGHEVLRNLITSGYGGALYAVNPKHREVLGVLSVGSVEELPTTPELAIVAVPARSVLEVVRACGERGVKAVLMLTAGFGEAGPAGALAQRELLNTVRSYGMRLVGPNCVGVVNTHPDVRLNATFAPMPMQPGHLAVASQSGALGIAVVEAAHAVGLGISQFVSLGNKADVSGNDLLLAWERDERTKVIALYLESFGDARKFSHLARRVSASKPIIAIKAGRSIAGQRAGQSHTAAAAAADDVVDALFLQAGVLRVDRMEEMLDTARVLIGQPLPRGARMVILGNSGGPEILAADAAHPAGLEVAALSDATQAALREAVPSAAAVANPVDLGAGVQPDEVAKALAIVLAAEEVDAVLTVFTDTLVAHADAVMSSIGYAADGVKPVVVVHVGARASTLPAADGVGSVPVFTFPEPAVAALGLAHRYAKIQARLHPVPPHRHDGSIEARELIERRLAEGVSWLGADDTSALLASYGISVCPQRVVGSADDAAHAAAELGYPVVAKLASGVVHKSEVGGVRLGIGDEAQLRAAYAELADIAGPKILVQPTLDTTTELIAGIVQDPQFGPVIMVGIGGVLADLIADRRLRLAPLGRDDAESMLGELRMVGLIDGYRGRPGLPRPALVQLLQNLSALAMDLPEVAELDLNPIVGVGEHVVVADVKIRIASSTRHDGLLRQLRG